MVRFVLLHFFQTGPITDRLIYVQDQKSLAELRTTCRIKYMYVWTKFPHNGPIRDRNRPDQLRAGGLLIHGINNNLEKYFQDNELGIFYDWI